MSLGALESALRVLDRHPPSFHSVPQREQALLEIGRFLETNIRAGQPYDLKTAKPNPVWDLMAARCSTVLDEIHEAPPPSKGLRLHQLYSSGVLAEFPVSRHDHSGRTPPRPRVREGAPPGRGSNGDSRPLEGVGADDGWPKARTRTIAFDVVPVLRAYGWDDTLGLTGRLADRIDALFITHRHGDHYDREFVRACAERGKPVYVPAHLADEWNGAPGIHAIRHDDRFEAADANVHAREGVHVWRESKEEVPLIYYEIVLPDDTCVIYGGDIDYTKDLGKSPGREVDVFFLPWRAPNACYEEGHPEQTGLLKEAVEIALWKIGPKALFYEHCAELEHVYDGFPASFDMALGLKRELPVRSELMFWGETMEYMT